LKPLIVKHTELIHDIAYDYYGRYIATCSSDQHIQVYLLSSNDGSGQDAIINSDSKANLIDDWKAHDSSIVKIKWAAPEFGNIIASCSFDKSVKIWQINLSNVNYNNDTTNNNANNMRALNKTKLLNKFLEANGPVYDIEFLPSHLGFKLATISSDGFIRFYELVDLSDFTSWQSLREFDFRSYLPSNHLSNATPQAYNLSWCPSKFSKERFIATFLNQAYIFQKHKQYEIVKSLNKFHTGLIRDVSWAPTMGRSYHLIATACDDGQVRVFKLYETFSSIFYGDNGPSLFNSIPDSNNNNNDNNNLITSNNPSISNNSSTSNTTSDAHQIKDDPSLALKLISTRGQHHSIVWSVSWNVTGTMLSSTGDDGKIMFWKMARNNEFICISCVTAER
ncbi:Seh1p, partial [Ascoidea rubescens DSM 1968]